MTSAPGARIDIDIGHAHCAPGWEALEEQRIAAVDVGVPSHSTGSGGDPRPGRPECDLCEANEVQTMRSSPELHLLDI